MEAKTRIANHTLAHLFTLVPADAAHVATFGGQGIEAEAWSEAGILRTNGWLIERSKRRHRQLMDRYPYQISCSNLSRFPNAFRENRGEDAGLDLFHWDLSGTVESASRTLPAILPLIMKGKGNLLAVTCADSRMNTSLKEPVLIKKVGRAVFGEAVFDGLHEHLCELYRNEPCDGPLESFVTSAALREQRSQNTALRELGALLHLLFACASIPGTETSISLPTPIEALHELFEKKIKLRQFRRVLTRTRLPVTLKLIERAVYISRYAGNPMRMRHFLFRLISCEQGDTGILDAAAAFAAHLMTLPCRYIHDETDVLFKPTEKETVQMTHDTQGNLPTLASSQDHQAEPVTAVAAMEHDRKAEIDSLTQEIYRIAQPIGGTFLASIQRLEQLARKPVLMQNPLIARLRALLDEDPGLMESAAAMREPTPAEDAPPVARAPRNKKRDANDLSVDEKDQIRLTIIRAVVTAKQEGKEPAQIEKIRLKTVQQLATQHGFGRASNRGNIIGGILARGSGSHRPGFVSRVTSQVATKRERTELLKLFALYWEMPVKELEAEIAAPVAPVT